MDSTIKCSVERKLRELTRGMHIIIYFIIEEKYEKLSVNLSRNLSEAGLTASVSHAKYMGIYSSRHIELMEYMPR